MQKTSKVHLAINIICFITIIISLYFGSSVFNALDNQHITHLNSQDDYNYSALDDIPVLTAQAVIIGGVFILAAFGLQVYSYILADFKLKKQVILALFSVYAILFFFSFFVLNNHEQRNFYDYGMIWVLLSLTLIFANSIFIFWRKA